MERQRMKNTKSRENERDDKFLADTGSMGHRGWIQNEDRDSRRESPRPVNYAELFTDLSPDPLLLYFREMKSDGKYRERARKKRKKEIHREEEAKYRRDVGLLQRDVIYFI